MSQGTFAQVVASAFQWVPADPAYGGTTDAQKALLAALREVQRAYQAQVPDAEELAFLRTLVNQYEELYTEVCAYASLPPYIRSRIERACPKVIGNPINDWGAQE